MLVEALASVGNEMLARECLMVACTNVGPSLVACSVRESGSGVSGAGGIEPGQDSASSCAGTEMLPQEC